MAQIPRLNRIEPQAGPKNDRINIQVQDNAQSIMQTTANINAVGDAGMDIFQKAENQKIETLSNVAELEFNNWNESQLQQLKQIQGDPTQAYQAYDEAVKKKKEEILSAYPDLSDRVKTHVTSRIDRTIASANISAGKQRGAQQDTYDQNIYENTVKMKKDGLSKNAGLIVAGDSSSYALLDMDLYDMKTVIANRGLKRGTVERLPDDAEGGWNHTYKDAEGKIVKVKMSDLALSDFAKHRAEGIKTSIEVLTAGGKIAEAKEMREKYADALDDLSKVKLDTKINKVGVKSEALKIVDETSHMNLEDFDAELESIEDPALKQEVIVQRNARDRAMSAMRTRQEKMNYDYLAKDITDRRKAGRPYTSVTELENDKKYGMVYDKMNHKQQTAIKEMIESPKESDLKVEARVQSLLASDEIYEMDASTFLTELNGLSQSDKKKAMNRFTSITTQTEGEKRASYKFASQELENELVLGGIISRDEKNNKVVGDDNEVFTEARRQLYDFMDEVGSMSPETSRKFVKDYAAAVIKDKAFNPEKYKKKKKQLENAGFKMPVGEELRKQQRAYKAKYNHFPRPDEQKQFEAFIKANS